MSNLDIKSSSDSERTVENLDEWPSRRDNCLVILLVIVDPAHVRLDSLFWIPS